MKNGQGGLPPVWKGNGRDTEDQAGGEWLAYVINDADMFPPPGLLDVSDPIQYIETSSGGDGDWLAFTSKKLYTNAFIVSPGPPQKVVSKMKPVASCFLPILPPTHRFSLAIRNGDLVHICESTRCKCRVSDSLSTRRYNGFGGKVEDGELPAQAAVRELKVCAAVLKRRVYGTPY